MKLSLNHNETELVAQVYGSMDAASITRDRDAVERILGAAKAAIKIDLTEVSFLDASGLGFLAHLVKRCRDAGIAFSLANAGGQPEAFLASLGLSSVFGIERNKADLGIANVAPFPLQQAA